MFKQNLTMLHHLFDTLMGGGWESVVVDCCGLIITFYFHMIVVSLMIILCNFRLFSFILTARVVIYRVVHCKCLVSP